MARVLVFTNTRKSKDTDPEYTIYIAPSEKREGSKGEAPPVSTPF